jgi:hypothetical protein
VYRLFLVSTDLLNHLMSSRLQSHYRKSTSGLNRIRLHTSHSLNNISHLESSDNDLGAKKKEKQEGKGEEGSSLSSVERSRGSKGGGTRYIKVSVSDRGLLTGFLFVLSLVRATYPQGVKAYNEKQ